MLLPGSQCEETEVSEKAVRLLFVYPCCYNNRLVIKHLSTIETCSLAALRLGVTAVHSVCVCVCVGRPLS